MKTIDERLREMVEQFDAEYEKNPELLYCLEWVNHQAALGYDIILDLLIEHSPDALDLEAVNEPGADDLSIMDLVVREIRRLQALDKKSDASS